MHLYQRWREIAAANADEWALREAHRSWTFRELQAELDTLPVATAPVILQGRNAAFVLGTLQAWRDGQLAVPVEEGVIFDAERAELASVPEGIVHVKTTSGSTGTPRHILFTAEQLAADAQQIISTMGLLREWPNVGVISLAHSYGFSNLVLPLLLHGIPLILVGDPLPETMRRALARGESQGEGFTIPAVPAMWRTWHSAGILDPCRVKLGISAGAPLPLKLELAMFEACGLKVHNFLGASECGGIAYDRTDHPRPLDSDWMGSPMEGVSLSVGSSGTLCVKSAAVGQAYWPQPDTALSGEGTFQTSDLVRLENSSEVYLLGRADDVINVSGRKVHPGEIELLLNSQADVLSSVVFSVPSANALRGEDMVVLVNLRAGAEVAKIKRELANDLAGAEWKLPRRWQIEPQLAPDQRGKISRAAWKARFLDRK
ncbi:MAG: acyl--CoA ligase [Verrucomicrobiae bacterium]|nr:acyl--CoA ligase [Verrucomicrobiae bacterium]